MNRRAPLPPGNGRGDVTDRQGFLNAFFRGILARKAAVIIVAAILAAAAVPGLLRLDITVNIEDFFLEDDPVLRNQQEFRRLFHNNDFVGVLVESDDVFSRASLEAIRTVGDRLRKEVPLAKEVVSPVHISGPFGPGMALRFKDGRLLETDATVGYYKQRCNESGYLRGVLFSSDNRQAWIRLGLHPYPQADEWKGEEKPLFAVGRAAYDVVRSVRVDNVRFTATGVPVYAYRKEAEMMEDLGRILALGAAVALLLTILIFRNIRGVAGALGVLGLSVITVFGMEGWVGASMDSAFIAVPVLLAMGVSIGYSVHINRFFRLRFQQTGDRAGSVVYALEKSARPILFTAFTTVAALLSFVFVEIKPIRWVGITSALSITSVYIYSMLFFPVFLASGPDREPSTEGGRLDVFEKTLRLFSLWLSRYSAPIMIVFIALTAVALAGVSRLKVDFDAEKMMGTELPHMKDQARIGESEIASGEAMDLVLLFPKGGLEDPGNVRMVENLERAIDGLPLVKRTTSLAGMVRNMDSLMYGKPAAQGAITGDRQMLGWMIAIAEKVDPDFLGQWMTGSRSTTRILIELSDFSSLAIERNINRIGELVAEHAPAATGHFFSGSTYQMAMMNQYVTRGLLRSVGTAFVIICVLMVFVFRCVRLGIIAMIPNIFPVLIVGGIMGYCDIPLEFVTMTVAPMIMGLAVDDTIHLLSHLRSDIEESGDFARGLSHTFSVVGSAVTETSIILCLSFIVLAFSRVASIATMGVIASAGILAAYLSDIFVTPILMKKMKYASWDSSA